MNYIIEIQRFEQHMITEEKSAATIDKHLRDIRGFCSYLTGQRISKEKVIAYKEHLTGRYAPASVNSMLIAINRFLRFLGLRDCCVRLLKIQRQMFCNEDKELTKQELHQLVKAAGNTRLSLVIRTICGTGIRVSELQYITAEAVFVTRNGKPLNRRPTQALFGTGGKTSADDIRMIMSRHL